MLEALGGLASELVDPMGRASAQTVLNVPGDLDACLDSLLLRSLGAPAKERKETVIWAS